MSLQTAAERDGCRAGNVWYLIESLGKLSYDDLALAAAFLNGRRPQARRALIDAEVNVNRLIDLLGKEDA